MADYRRCAGWTGGLSLVVVTLLVVELLLIPTNAFAVAATPRTGSAASTAPPVAAPRLAPRHLKIMNYYPSGAGWSAMWTKYSPAQTEMDFAAIASLGANTVRIIVQPDAVGWPAVTPVGAATLRDMVDIAQRHGLGVELTLFDLWYSWDRIAESAAWATQLLGPYRNDPRIVLVELQNEMPANDTTLAWARALLPQLGTLLPGVPRSLSSNNTASLQAIAAAVPAASLDVIDIHLYGSIQLMPAQLAAARAVAAERPVIVGEAGASTGLSPLPGSEQAQLTFFQKVSQLVIDAGICHFAPWILSDFTLAAMPSFLRGPVEAKFGLRRLDGSWKPAAQVVRDMFANRGNPIFAADQLAAARIDADGGFEKENTAPSANGELGSWTAFDAEQANRLGTGPVSGSEGRRAAVIGRSGGSASMVPAVYQSFLLLSGRRTVSLSARVRTLHATGFSRVTIAWFDGSRYLGSTEGRDVDNTANGWHDAVATGTAPPQATSFQVHLKSAYNTGLTYFDSVTLN